MRSAQDIYHSLKEEIQYIQIHRDQIFREYEKHKDWAEVAEAKLNSLVEIVLTKYHVNLKEYDRVVLPVHEGSALL